MKLHKESIVDNMVFVTGITRSGKSMVCPIVSSFNRADNVRMSCEFEQFPALFEVGKISSDAAVYMMRYGTNIMFYNNQIGRDANFRFDDFSSIWKTEHPEDYFRRLSMPEGDIVFDRIREQSPIFVLMVHNALWHASLYFDAFPAAKMIHVDRHPVDLISSWYKKGYGGSFSEGPRNTTLSFNINGCVVPYLAYDCPEIYTQMKGMDRLVNMINNLYRKNYFGFDQLQSDKKNNVLFVNFEDMVQFPDRYVNEISNFIGTEKTSYTDQVLVRERCPRVLNIDDRENKLKSILKECSTESKKILEVMVEDYERKFNV